MSKIKTRPVRGHRPLSELSSRKTNNYATKKSTAAAKLETLRRKTIRSEKYGSAK